jgi:uncharacterized Fe-S center protein
VTAEVYFSNCRSKARLSLIDKIGRLFQAAGFPDLIGRGRKVAIKVHWGEPGNVGFIPHPYSAKVVSEIKRAEGIPFVTDSNTLYAGERYHAITNLMAAGKNGFTLETLGAPVIIADGLCGLDYETVPVDGEILKEAKIASAIYQADGVIALSHMTGHMVFGFASTLKNIGMGCAAAPGKQVLHSDMRPKVNVKKCTGCGTCIAACPVQAICLVNEKASIDRTRCIGCGECVVVCPERAIPVNWKTSEDRAQKKTAEYAAAVVKAKGGRCGFFNFLLNVAPDCDCCNWNDAPFVPDIGFLASRDPVAVDQAAVDLVNAAPGAAGSALEGLSPGEDKFRALHDIDYTVILDHAEWLGLGTRNYKLLSLDE